MNNSLYITKSMIKMFQICKLHWFFSLNLIFGWVSIANAQNFSDNLTQIREVPTTPTMWEFQKYGTYPVSMHTGVPNISIPIYTAKSGEIEIPVSLSYHASGIKVDQKASWVGLGWSLFAGGAITRTIRGSVDEYSQGYINYNFHEQGTFNPATGSNYNVTEQMIQGFIDTEPDIFQYNFMGYSGSFIFEPDTGTSAPIIALVPHNDLKIKPTFVVNSLDSFTITTPEGYIAEFAAPEISNEYRPAGLIGSINIIGKTAWHLMKITAPNGVDEITFQYKTLGSFTDERYSQSESLNFNDPCNSNNHGPITPNFSSNGVFFTGVKRLERINFANGYVLFQSSSGNRLDDPTSEDVRLDAIKIYSSINGVTSLNKTFDLDYGYLGTVINSNSIPNDREVRLKLEKITEKGRQGASKNPYEFDYFENINARTMPYRFANSQDYWGYYNGIPNASMVPSYTYTTTNGSFILGDANRNVDSNHGYARIGTINKITYPTKGYTEFEFENNSVTVTIASNQQQELVGGLRIKNIKSYDYDNSLQWQKSYEYVQRDDTTLSSGVYNGVNFIEPRDYFNSREYHFGSLQVGSCIPTGTYYGYSTHSVSMASSPNLSNNHASAFYAHVKEYNGSSTNHEGYTWYKFDATKDNFVQGIGPVSFPIDRSWDRGQILVEETFVNGSNSPIKKVTNNYEEIAVRTPVKAYKPGTRFDVQSLGYVPQQIISQGSTYAIEQFRSNQYFLTYFDQPIVWKRLQSKTVESDGVVVTETFAYNTNNDHTNTTSVSMANSNGNTFELKTYYPDDIQSISSLEGGTLSNEAYTAINKLKKNGANRRVGQPIQTNTIENGALNLQRTNFKDWGNNIIKPKSVESFKSTPSPSSSNTIQSRVAYHDYDDRGNLLEVSLVDGAPVSYIWGYNKQYPVAKIENATRAQIESLSGFGPNFHSGADGLSSAQENTLRTGLPNAMTTTYDYEPLVGIISIIDPRGYKSTFHYDEFNRLEFVKDASGKLVSENKYNYKNN